VGFITEMRPVDCEPATTIVDLVLRIQILRDIVDAILESQILDVTGCATIAQQLLQRPHHRNATLDREPTTTIDIPVLEIQTLQDPY
jgi:hypothetical protein